MTPQQRSRLALIFIVLLFGTPFVTAVVLRFGGWQPGQTRNYGTLVQPPQDWSAMPLKTVDGAAYPWDPEARRWHLLLLPVVALLQLMFSIGLGCLLALLGLVMRDVSFIIQYIVIAMLVVTPIAYTPDMIPASIKPLLYLNPLYYFVSANQHLILMNTLPPLIEVGLGSALAISMLLVGVMLFKRARMAMLDLL